MKSKKELPKTKKKFKDFIIEDEAKVIDKSAVKISMIGTFVIISGTLSTNAGNAILSSHSNNVEHGNETTLAEQRDPPADMRDIRRPVHPDFIPFSTDESEYGFVVWSHSNDFEHGDDSGFGGLGGLGAAFGGVFGGFGGAAFGGAIGVFADEILGPDGDASVSVDGVESAEELKEVSTLVLENYDGSYEPEE